MDAQLFLRCTCSRIAPCSGVLTTLCYWGWSSQWLEPAYWRHLQSQSSPLPTRRSSKRALLTTRHRWLTGATASCWVRIPQRHAQAGMQAKQVEASLLRSSSQSITSKKWDARIRAPLAFVHTSLFDPFLVAVLHWSLALGCSSYPAACRFQSMRTSGVPWASQCLRPGRKTTSSVGVCAAGLGIWSLRFWGSGRRFRQLTHPGFMEAQGSWNPEFEPAKILSNSDPNSDPDTRDQILPSTPFFGL